MASRCLQGSNRSGQRLLCSPGCWLQWQGVCVCASAHAHACSLPPGACGWDRDIESLRAELDGVLQSWGLQSPQALVAHRIFSQGEIRLPSLLLPAPAPSPHLSSFFLPTSYSLFFPFLSALLSPPLPSLHSCSKSPYSCPPPTRRPEHWG